MKKQTGRILAFFAALILCFTVFSAGASAASKKCSKIYGKIEKAYGKSFTLKKKNQIKTKRKNIFGEYSKVMGVSARDFSDYKAARIANSKYEYACFVCRAADKSKVSRIKEQLKDYVKDEKSSNENYFSDKGKELMNNACITSKGKYVALFILDTDKNKKAAGAFEKAAK